jgi:hypothetical protein
MIARLLVASLALFALAGPAFAAERFPVELQFSPIDKFRVAGAEGDYGRLTFIGGFSMTGDRREFGQLSGFRFLTPGGDFLGVADHGYWFSGAVLRDGEGVPVGLDDFSMQQMIDAAGTPIDDKEQIDAEGISIHDGVATVSFERRARVSEYAIDRDGMSAPTRDLDFLIPRNELRYNAGLEAVARSGADGPLQGARIVIAEKSIDRQGNIFAAILEGPRKGVFKVRRTDEFDVTDGVFLPDGDLLLLERRFSYARGVAMRLRRVAVDDIRADALVDGNILLDANMVHHVDNMEALDVFRRNDGTLVIALMSDDNQSWIQRNLYLEFELAED